MKAFLTLALVSLVFAGPSILTEDQKEVVPDSAIEYINTVQNLWVASSKWVKGMTKGEAKKFATLSFTSESLYPDAEILQAPRNLPWFFDTRWNFYGCEIPILDQGQCGSCWAFAAAETLSERVCIASQGNVHVVLSPQYLVSCDAKNYGCDGGYLGEAWNFMRKGIPSYNCVNYTASDSQCMNTCDDGSEMVLYKAANVQAFRGPQSIKVALFTEGPVETGFEVYEDFLSYSSGIYVHTYGGLLGGHAVKIVGWGVSGNVEYWTCANSWGTGWGYEGYFYIAFGQCGIDSLAYAGRAILPPQ
ncbi:hypothetical protein SteCoe_23883 [Stentor coeruleus]|uniref:Peptidase C1A papain C-terminal domain-containing protein n=1 Tax=Stentor coeruleus TaxID=5963 RepID=A0A1R2BIS5_9CILI|nr:hypothetical protein SteCoe_23883 [Stentor coeruleus]